jgi:hypothetical protein
MTIAPPRKKSRAVFWIATIVIGSAILATVLLANDQRNLKALAHRYHVTWFDQPAIIAAKPIVVAKTRPKPAQQILLSDHLLEIPKPELTGSFIRTWRISGEDLCGKLTEAGLPLSEWKQSGFDTGTFECSYETNSTRGADMTSLFLIVRGTPSGDVANIRIKVILPDTDAGRAMREKFNAAVDTLIRESQWPDFQTSADSIERLENVTQTAFGAKLTFSHEFDDARRFNLILELERHTPEQRRTAAFFDEAKWLPPAPIASTP